MEYSTQKLAKLVGVSIRTIRHYDEIGLLSPKIRMVNGRCYYGMKEAICLSRIISLKELGFSLSKIKSIINEKAIYKKISALVVQKKILRKEQDRLKTGLQMIDLMIKCYKENCMIDITPEAIEANFEQMKNKKEYAKYFEEAYSQEKAKELNDRFKLRVDDKYYDVFLKKAERQNIITAQAYGARYGSFLKKLSVAFENGLDENSSKVQSLIGDQWEILQMVYPKTNSYKIYIAIRDQLNSYPKEGINDQDKALMDYMFKAMTIFAENHFSKD